MKLEPREGFDLQIPIQNIKRMTKNNPEKNLNGFKFLEGRPEQIKESSETFIIRRDQMGFYIAWTNKVGPVTGTGNFKQWTDAKYYLENNWRRLIDEEFEREVLIGSGKSEVDNTSKD